MVVGNLDTQVAHYVRYMCGDDNLLEIPLEYDGNDYVRVHNALFTYPEVFCGKEIIGLKRKDPCTDVVNIICNPPYGDDGAKIVKLLKEKLNYEKFSNIEQLKDYKSDNLFSYVDVDSVVTLDKNSFEDADVKPSIALINKSPDMSLTFDEVEIRSVINEFPLLTKLCRKNYSILHPYINKVSMPSHGKQSTSCNPWDVHTTVILPMRMVSNGTIPKDKNTAFRFN